MSSTSMYISETLKQNFAAFWRILCSPKIHILYRACSLWSRPHLHGTRLDAIPSQGFWELFTRGQHFFDLQHEDQSEWNHLSGAWKFLSPTSTRWVSVSESPSLSISQLVYDFIAFFHYKFGFSEIGGTPKPSKPWVSILKWSKFGWFRVPPISGNLQIGIAQHFFLTFPVFPEVIRAWCSKIQSKHFWRLTRTCNACKDWSNKPPRRLSPGIFSTARGWRKPQFLGYPIYKMVYNWLVVSTLWKMMEFVSWEGWQPIYYGKKNVWSHQPV